ncbi:hypothetical protein GCM10011348_07530 [Marinobacterium nitratireducens]|uniref:ParE-like toxin domain-containing protein n=1 Tax=Marinobacterium nitratireducens TaxID=518897 RepID=A0A917ZAN1_9GAMM|nr:hypothetical protein [Marinobacterium nitratireducens]GGO77602.1 hypothetical protein GCM10011348_07530 [Marinobacterium nitratireducens]
MDKGMIRELDPLDPGLRRKAERMIAVLQRHPAKATRLGGKKLRGYRKLVRFKINCGYRMVVSIEQLTVGPYLCMAHDTFDRRYG